MAPTPRKSDHCDGTGRGPPRLRNGADECPAPASFASGPCVEYPEGVPFEAYGLDEFVRSHNFSPPPGYAGGKIYRADDPFMSRYYKDNVLVGTLREYDLYPKVAGQPRRAERIIVAENLRMSWYTPDHYRTFIDMYDFFCLGLPHIPII